MRPGSPFFSLFLLIFAGFLFSTALTPFVRSSNPPLSRLLLPPSPSKELSVPFSASPGARSILCSGTDGSGKFGKILLASLDGNLRLMDTESLKLEWVISTGESLKDQWINSTDHFCYLGEDWSLYEYHKDCGAKKLDFTLEEAIHKLTKVDSRSATIGSVSSTLIYVDETSGKLLLKYSLPSSTDAESVVDEKVIREVRDGSKDGNVIAIVRKDYMLKCLAFGETLWSLRAAHVTAHVSKYENWLLPSSGDVPALFPLLEEQVPVCSMPEIGKVLGPNEYHMLPPANNHQDRVVVNQPNEEQENAYSITFDANCSADSSSSGSSVPSMLPVDNISRVPHFLPLSNQFQLWPYHDMESSPVGGGDVNKNHGVKYEAFAWVVILTLLILCALYNLIRGLVKSGKQSFQLKGRETVVSRKRKARKAGNAKISAIVGSHHSPNSSETENSESNELLHLKNNEKYPFFHLVRDNNANDGRWVGKLLVMNSEIGKGSNGTIVLEGFYDGRPVAVKRLLRAHNEIAFKEIQNLIASDRHPNIVRWYGFEQDSDFVYIALERCSCSLGDLVQLLSESSSHPNTSETPSSSSINEHSIELDFLRNISKDLELWRDDGFPSPQLLKLMRDVVSGLAHLHELGIIHRDLKPQNVLISSDKFLKAKLSDMGISKRLPENMSSLGHHATGYGSSGWQAPEQLLHGRQTRAVDLFSLGCILFFCITKGKHPFGNYFERDTNIVNNRVDLFLVDHIPEAVHLLSLLLESNPDNRPNAVETLHHPLFWNSEMRLSFLRDVSDRVELEDREQESVLLKALEAIAPAAFGGKWGEKLDAAFISDMGRYRKYNFDFTRDLLRVIRNKLNHYRELPKELQEILGPLPEGFDNYFSKRFPNLLIEVYKVVRNYCSEEDSFCKYFQSHLD